MIEKIDMEERRLAERFETFKPIGDRLRELEKGVKDIELSNMFNSNNNFSSSHSPHTLEPTDTSYSNNRNSCFSRNTDDQLVSTSVTAAAAGSLPSRLAGEKKPSRFL